jgi:ureidoglycolate lyase
MVAGIPFHARSLVVEPLTAEAFAPFGDVVAAGNAKAHYGINQGFAERHHDITHLDATAEGGRAIVSIFSAQPRELPLRLGLVERHLLGSQAFVPLAGQRFLVVVAPAGPAPQVSTLRCFLAEGGQGINMARGVWHHPLLAIDAAGSFLVIDRAGPGAAEDCEEHNLFDDDVWVAG